LIFDLALCDSGRPPVLAFWRFFGALKTTHLEAKVQMHSPMRIKR
jgi:hypothetical protein